MEIDIDKCTAYDLDNKYLFIFLEKTIKVVIDNIYFHAHTKKSEQIDWDIEMDQMVQNDIIVNRNDDQVFHFFVKKSSFAVKHRS